MLSQISPAKFKAAPAADDATTMTLKHLASKGHNFARVGGVYLSASQALCASPTALDDAGRVGLMTKTVSSAEYNKLDAAFVESATAIASPSSTSTRHANTVEKLLQEAHPTWVAELALNMAVTGCTQWVLGGGVLPMQQGSLVCSSARRRCGGQSAGHPRRVCRSLC